MKRIWSMEIPYNYEFASIDSIYVPPDHFDCSECRHAEQPKLLVEWADGSNVIGDFVSADARIVARQDIVIELLDHFHGAQAREIEMLDHPNLYRPSRITKRTPTRVWLPYVGPKLVELEVVKKVPLDPSSTVHIQKICPACGSITYKSIDGIETKDTRVHTKREKDKGLFIKKSDIDNCAIFKPEFTGFILCLSPVKEFIESRNWNNIEFMEVGNLLE